MIGITIAVVPSLWLSHFTDDPQVYAYGALHLSIAAPCYGLFGGGQTLYFASQGTGKMGWPVTVSVVRFLAVAGISVLALAFSWQVTAVFVAVSLGMTTIGFGTLLCLRSRDWYPDKARGAKGLV